MSKSMLESFAATSDTLLRIFAILAALCAVAYLFSGRHLQRVNRAAEEKTTLEAEKHRGDMQAELSDANKKLEELRGENAKLAGDLKKEQQAAIEIQRRFGPRGIWPDAKSAMVDMLQPFTGQRVSFAYFTELETAAFAERVLEILKTAGWKPQVFKLKSMPPIYGVHCGGPNPDDPAFAALRDSLKLVDKHLATQDAEAAATMRNVQPQATDQPWVLVALKRPHLRSGPVLAVLPDEKPDAKHETSDRD